MKFKVGDKVVFKRSNDPSFVNSMAELIGRESVVTKAWINEETGKHFCHVKGSIWNWHESALELVESQEYFYVGQTVYSPLFKNKERSGKVIKIERGDFYPILCKSDDKRLCFTLDGKHTMTDDFISLFQEPIQFPVNKPIERFEQGEIVEVSDDGLLWVLAYFYRKTEHNTFKYMVYRGRVNGEAGTKTSYAKIRKIK